MFGAPIVVPPPGEYVADGAARQAAWVLSGADEAPAWPGARPGATSTYEPEPALRVPDLLCFAVHSTAHALARAYRPHLEPLGLTYPQYLVMVALWTEGPQRVGALGARLFLDSSTLTPLPA